MIFFGVIKQMLLLFCWLLFW